jgi:hypothetical protein
MRDVGLCPRTKTGACGHLMRFPECALAEEELWGTHNHDPAEDGQGQYREHCRDDSVSEFLPLRHGTYNGQAVDPTPRRLTFVSLITEHSYWQRPS